MDASRTDDQGVPGVRACAAKREVQMGILGGGQSIRASGRTGCDDRPDTNPHSIRRSGHHLDLVLDPQRASTQSPPASVPAAPA